MCSQSAVAEKKATFATPIANPGGTLKTVLVPPTSAVTQGHSKDLATKGCGLTPAESDRTREKVNREKNQNLGLRVCEGSADKRTTETTCCVASCPIMRLYLATR